MTTKKNFAMLVLMSIAAAATMTFTSCSDELNEMSANKTQAPEGADKSLLEAYGLTFENFINDNDVIILNADTTMLSVSKAYADKMGITSFVNHPMGIWHKMEQLPYIRKATAQKLDGDRYILTVKPATVAEIVGDKNVTLSTSLYVNANAENVATRAAGDGLPEYAAKFVDAENVIHPAVIHLTDPYGYDKDWNLPDEQPSAVQTRAASSGEYQYYRAEDLATVTRWGDRKRILSLNSSLNFNHKFECGPESGDSITLNGKIPVDFELDYFITLNGGVHWKVVVPVPYVEKFEAGIDGKFGFHPECYVGFSKKVGLPKDLQKINLAKFKGYTFTFWVGPVPVIIECNPNMYLKFTAEVEGNARIGFKYDYENEFRAGTRYEDGKGWKDLSYFKENKNEFTFVRPELNFQAKAGVGFFLGVDVKIYGVAGPTLAVGPSLESKASMTISPWAEQESDKFLLKGSVDLKVQAEVGAKLEVLGYELAEWKTAFDLAGPWNIWKYPSDGLEHKCGMKDGEKSVWEQFLEFVDKSNYGARCREVQNEIIGMMKEMYGCDDEYARAMLLSHYTTSGEAPQIVEHNCEGFYLDLCYYRDEVRQKYKDWEYQMHVQKGDIEWINAENWRRISEEVIANYRLDSSVITPQEAMNNIHKWFLNEFKREPAIASPEDVKWIAEKYRDYSKWSWEYRDQSSSQDDADAAAEKAAEEKAEQEAKEKAEAEAKAKEEEAEANWQKVLAILMDMHQDDFTLYKRQASKSATSARKGFVAEYNREPTTSAADIAILDSKYTSVMALHK